jgi:hypothetical protein
MQRIGDIPGFAIWFFIASRQLGVLVSFFTTHLMQELKMDHIYITMSGKKLCSAAIAYGAS